MSIGWSQSLPASLFMKQYWAAIFLHGTEQGTARGRRSGIPEAVFFHADVSWCVNRKDRFGKNVFEAGARTPRPRTWTPSASTPCLRKTPRARWNVSIVGEPRPVASQREGT